MGKLLFSIAVLLLLPLAFAQSNQTYSCDLDPMQINALAGTAVMVTPSCYADSEPVPCPPGFSWSATIGSVNINPEAPFSAIFNSGTAPGSGAITASGDGFSCSSVVSVASPSPSGASTGGAASGGSNTGGAIFRTSSTVAVSCAGKPSSVKVTYYDKSAPKATVDIFYFGAGELRKIFSQEIGSTATLSFTPEKAGEYELHVSLGPDQATQSFSVKACSQQDENSTQETPAVRLESKRELVLSKTISYEGGFSKDFRVYKVAGDDEGEYYATEITLSYTYSGNAPRENFTISDSVPKAVVSKANQISFKDYPSYFASEPEVRFEWDISYMKKGETFTYSYGFSRSLTEQMIGRFSPPSASAFGERARTEQEPEASTDLVASLISTEIFNIPLSYVLASAVGMVLVAMLLSFFFGRRGN